MVMAAKQQGEELSEHFSGVSASSESLWEEKSVSYCIYFRFLVLIVLSAPLIKELFISQYFLSSELP